MRSAEREAGMHFDDADLDEAVRLALTGLVQETAA